MVLLFGLFFSASTLTIILSSSSFVRDKMLINDKAFVVVNATQINKTLSAFGHEEKMAKKILIIGGGNIGFNLAKNLENDSEGIRVKIIEKNKDRAELIANELNNTIVINGDGLEEDVLKEANIEEAETILSLTNDDEDNIMVCVLAEKITLIKEQSHLLTNRIIVYYKHHLKLTIW